MYQRLCYKILCSVHKEENENKVSRGCLPSFQFNNYTDLFRDTINNKRTLGICISKITFNLIAVYNIVYNLKIWLTIFVDFVARNNLFLGRLYLICHVEIG